MCSDTVTNTHYWYLQTDYNKYNKSGDLTGHFTGNRVLSATDSKTSGGPMPGWRLKIRRADSATTSFSGIKWKLISRYGDAIWQRKTSPFDSGVESGDNFRQVITWSPVSGGVNTQAADRAASKLLQHYIEATNTWRGGNFLAEVRETIHMLRHPVESLYRRTWEHAGNLKRLRRVYKQKPLDLKKALADAWLGWRFGVNPLIQDANDAAKALRQLSDRRGFDLKPLNGFGRSTLASITPTTNGTPINSIGYFYDKMIKNDFTIRYHGFMKCDPSNWQWQIAQCGISNDDLLPAVWEGTPFSWLVDYFVNVGEVLDSIRLWGIELAWLNVTIRNAGTINGVFRHMQADDATFRYSGNPGSYYTLYVTVSREKSALPYPRFHFQMPGFPSLKWLNIAALLTQIKGA